MDNLCTEKGPNELNKSFAATLLPFDSLPFTATFFKPNGIRYPFGTHLQSHRPPLLLLNAAHLLPMAPRASAKSALQIKVFPTSPWFPWRSEWMLPSFLLLSRWRGSSRGLPLWGLGVSEHPAVLQLPLPCAATGQTGWLQSWYACDPVPVPHSTAKHPRHARSRFPG